MRHDWLFEVLDDLRAYAALNGLPATVAKLDEAIRIAHAEASMGHDLPPHPIPALPLMAKRPN